jgi:rhodanese-related sulfurtransferase
MDVPPPAGSSATVVNEISPKDALPKVEAAYSQFIDVRTPAEFAAGHATRARNIPLETLANNLDMIEKNEPVYVICETGRRSKEAADILSKNGFKYVFNVTGGTAAWRTAELPMTKPAPPQ